jgi:type IV pilus assembly protein PilA
MIKMLKNKLKEEKGLTLIELLAVIVILGIIAAIAIPSIGKVISNSKDKAQIAEAIQIIDAARLSHADDPSIVQWVHDKPSTDTDATHASLKDYVSKVKSSNIAYVVTYDATTKSFSITHPGAAGVLGETDGIVTEAQLAAKAGK